MPGDVHTFVARILQARQRLTNVQKTVLQAGIKQVARRRECNGAHAPLKKLDAQQGFKAANLMADSAGTDAELLCRLGEAQVAGGGFKDPQGAERRGRM